MELKGEISDHLRAYFLTARNCNDLSPSPEVNERKELIGRKTLVLKNMSLRTLQ